MGWCPKLECSAPQTTRWARGLGTRPQVVLKTIWDLPCVLAGVLSYVQGSSLLCNSKVFCAVLKSTVQWSSLLRSSSTDLAGVLPPAGQSFGKCHAFEDVDVLGTFL